MARGAGDLRERVAFDAPSGGLDAFGGQNVGWTEHHVCWAQIIYAKGDETVQSARQAGRKAFKVVVRSTPETRAVTEDYRMRDILRGLPSGVSGDPLPGDRWNITEVDAITDRRWVFIVVEGPVTK